MYTFTFLRYSSLFYWRKALTNRLKPALLVLSAFLFFVGAKAQTETPLPNPVVVCGFEVKTELTLNSPENGKTTVKWTIKNTNPGNGTGGTYQNLSHWALKVCFTNSSVANASPSVSFGQDPSQTCLQGADLMKFNEGTSGDEDKTYTLILNGTNYSLTEVDAVFKSGSSAYEGNKNCCVGKIWGVSCSAAPCVETTTAPTIDPICAGATQVSGTKASGATVEVTSGVQTATVSYDANDNTKWTGTFATALAAGDVVGVSAAEEAKCPASASVTVQDNTLAPTVDPLCAGATTVAGTSEVGATIQVYKQGTAEAIGSTTAGNDGTWSVMVAALAANDVITATAQAPDECASGASASVTVRDNTAAPTVDPLCAGATSVSGSSVAGASIAVYKNVNGTAVAIGMATAGDDGKWSVTIETALVATDVITATAQVTGECVSVASASVTVMDNTVAPTIDPLCAGATTVTGTSEAGATIQVYKQGTVEAIGTATAGNDGNWSASVVALAAGDVITATAQALNECASSVSASVTVRSLPGLTVKNLTNVCPTMTVDLTTAVTGGTGNVNYFEANGTTLVANTAEVGAGTFIIEMIGENGCSERKTVTVTIVNCAEGCTPGYWKNRKTSWNTVSYVNVSGVTYTNVDVRGCVVSASNALVRQTPSMTNTGELSSALFRVVFDLTENQVEAKLGKNTKGITLLQALGLGDGSGYTQLARAGTAALLNQCAMNYAPTTSPDITSANIVSNVKAQFVSNDRAAALALALRYDGFNNSNCLLTNSAVKPTITRISIGGSAEIVESVTKLTVSASPNPFTDRIRFTIQAPKAGRATLEVYNMLGQKVGVPFEGQLNAGETRNVEYTAPANHRSNLIYMLRMNGEQVSGKLMSTRQ